MPTVHIFISSGRFHSFKELRLYIDETYTDDGDGIPSAFMREVGLSEYEPMCIEAIWEEQPMSLPRLLDGVSYSGQWTEQLSNIKLADAAICVFEPNLVLRPSECSLEYCGAFEYKDDEDE